MVTRVISVDAKKHELIGPFKNAGRTWRRKGRPKRVNAYDFPSWAKGKGIPYGAYDEAHNEAVVSVGVTHETSEFAVASIRRWWSLAGRKRYPQAGRLLICADAGGSNGYRLRAWKFQLQQLANQLRMPITVCHYPPGTSKWNKIEHRLFSFISLNWKGTPLVSYETVVKLIGGTTTKTGLKVKAILDTNYYETGVEVTSSEMEQIQLRPHKKFPNWNYTISPHSRPTIFLRPVDFSALPKHPNKGGQPPAEGVEGSTMTKENMEQSNQRRTPSRESGPSGLERVRRAAVRFAATHPR